MKGSFVYDDRDDVFLWSGDNGEVKYGYAQGEPTPDGYKLWKKSCEKDGCPGIYKVYNECYNSDDDGKNKCFQHFYCVKSDDDSIFDDC